VIHQRYCFQGDWGPGWRDHHIAPAGRQCPSQSVKVSLCLGQSKLEALAAIEAAVSRIAYLFNYGRRIHLDTLPGEIEVGVILKKSYEAFTEVVRF
jgi:hypothetical protein